MGFIINIHPYIDVCVYAQTRRHCSTAVRLTGNNKTFSLLLFAMLITYLLFSLNTSSYISFSLLPLNPCKSSAEQWFLNFFSFSCCCHCQRCPTQLWSLSCLPSLFTYSTFLLLTLITTNESKWQQQQHSKTMSTLTIATTAILTDGTAISCWSYGPVDKGNNNKVRALRNEMTNK